MDPSRQTPQTQNESESSTTKTLGQIQNVLKVWDDAVTAKEYAKLSGAEVYWLIQHFSDAQTSYPDFELSDEFLALAKPLINAALPFLDQEQEHALGEAGLIYSQYDAVRKHQGFETFESMVQQFPKALFLVGFTESYFGDFTSGTLKTLVSEKERFEALRDLNVAWTPTDAPIPRKVLTKYLNFHEKFTGSEVLEVHKHRNLAPQSFLWVFESFLVDVVVTKCKFDSEKMKPLESFLGGPTATRFKSQLNVLETVHLYERVMRHAEKQQEQTWLIQLNTVKTSQAAGPALNGQERSRPSGNDGQKANNSGAESDAANDKRAKQRTVAKDKELQTGDGRLAKWERSIVAPHVRKRVGGDLPVPSLQKKGVIQTNHTVETLQGVAARRRSEELKQYHEVFYSSGPYAYEIKPEYSWILLEKKPDGSLYLTKEQLSRVFPEWWMVLALVETGETPGSSECIKRGPKPAKGYEEWKTWKGPEVDDATVRVEKRLDDVEKRLGEIFDLIKKTNNEGQPGGIARNLPDPSHLITRNVSGQKDDAATMNLLNRYRDEIKELLGPVPSMVKDIHEYGKDIAAVLHRHDDDMKRLLSSRGYRTQALTEGDDAVMESSVKNLNDQIISAITDKVSGAVDSWLSKLDEKFTTMDSKLTKIDALAAKLDERSVQGEQRLARIDTMAGKMNERSAQMDKSLAEINAVAVKLDERSTQADERLARLDTMAGKMNERSTQMDKNLVGINAMAVDLKKKSAVFDKQLDEFSGMIDQLGERCEAIKEKFANIEGVAVKMGKRAQHVDKKITNLDDAARFLDERSLEIVDTLASMDNMSRNMDKLSSNMQGICKKLQIPTESSLGELEDRPPSVAPVSSKRTREHLSNAPEDSDLEQSSSRKRARQESSIEEDNLGNSLGGDPYWKDIYDDIQLEDDESSEFVANDEREEQTSTEVPRDTST